MQSTSMYKLLIPVTFKQKISLKQFAYLKLWTNFTPVFNIVTMYR